MINPRQLRDLVIVPVCRAIAPGEDIEPAVQLMLGTAMQESNCGEFIAQVGGPALGVWQMEPTTFLDIVDTSLDSRRRATLQELLGGSDRIFPSMMVWNLNLACYMARLLYRRVPFALPSEGDTVGQAVYYKNYYNTPAGAATVDEYLGNWLKLQALL